jgi:hypothetical protein
VSGLVYTCVSNFRKWIVTVTAFTNLLGVLAESYGNEIESELQSRWTEYLGASPGQ